MQAPTSHPQPPQPAMAGQAGATSAAVADSSRPGTAVQKGRTPAATAPMTIQQVGRKPICLLTCVWQPPSLLKTQRVCICIALSMLPAPPTLY